MSTPSSQPTGEEHREVLFREDGGSWWVVLIGPVLVLAVILLEAFTGDGHVHWAVLIIFGLIVTGFSAVQVVAARRHVSVELTDTHLRQGTKTIALTDIRAIYPENRGSDAEKWESAPALGELSGVPRRRHGIGLRFDDGKLAQAWARDVDTFRRELSEAHLAAQIAARQQTGETKRKKRSDKGSGPASATDTASATGPAPATDTAPEDDTGRDANHADDPGKGQSS